MFSDDGVACLEEFLVLDRLVVSCLTSIPFPFHFHPNKWQVKLRRAYFELVQMRSSLMLWDAASCKVMRMAAISAYCDD